VPGIGAAADLEAAPMRAEFVNPFLASMLEVMSTMANLELTPGKPQRKTDERALGDVSGLIGMLAPQTRGSMSVTFQKSLALEAMRRMLGEAPAEINDEVTDMVGEITNMVTGGAKRRLAEQGFDFEMATPMVVAGADHSIRHHAQGPRIYMPFESKFGRAIIEICFE
jgi:chemotaxis protein CheX